MSSRLSSASRILSNFIMSLGSTGCFQSLTRRFLARVERIAQTCSHAQPVGSAPNQRTHNARDVLMQKLAAEIAGRGGDTQHQDGFDCLFWSVENGGKHQPQPRPTG